MLASCGGASVKRGFRAMSSRRFSHELPESPVELGKRLEADIERDLADAQIWILQQVAGFFDPGAGNKFNKIDRGRFLEFLAEVGGAHVHNPRDASQRQFFVGMIINKGLRPRHRGRCILRSIQDERLAA